MGDFDGKVALVTGAALGVGAAIAAALAEEGAAVGLIDIDPKALDETVATINAAGGGPARAFAGDVRDGDHTERTVAALVEEFGGLDTLINNAGVVRYGYMPTFSEEDWDYVFDINIKGMYRTAK